MASLVCRPCYASVAAPLLRLVDAARASMLYLSRCSALRSISAALQLDSHTRARQDARGGQRHETECASEARSGDSSPDRCRKAASAPDVAGAPAAPASRGLQHAAAPFLDGRALSDRGVVAGPPPPRAGACAGSGGGTEANGDAKRKRAFAERPASALPLATDKALRPLEAGAAAAQPCVSSGAGAPPTGGALADGCLAGDFDAFALQSSPAKPRGLADVRANHVGGSGLGTAMAGMLSAHSAPGAGALGCDLGLHTMAPTQPAQSPPVAAPQRGLEGMPVHNGSQQSRHHHLRFSSLDPSTAMHAQGSALHSNALAAAVAEAQPSWQRVPAQHAAPELSEQQLTSLLANVVEQRRRSMQHSPPGQHAQAQAPQSTSLQLAHLLQQSCTQQRTAASAPVQQGCSTARTQSASDMHFGLAQTEGPVAASQHVPSAGELLQPRPHVQGGPGATFSQHLASLQPSTAQRLADLLPALQQHASAQPSGREDTTRSISQLKADLATLAAQQQARPTAQLPEQPHSALASKSDASNTAGLLACMQQLQSSMRASPQIQFQVLTALESMHSLLQLVCFATSLMLMLHASQAHWPKYCLACQVMMCSRHTGGAHKQPSEQAPVCALCISNLSALFTGTFTRQLIAGAG